MCVNPDQILLALATKQRRLKSLTQVSSYNTLASENQRIFNERLT